jgi:hypothetical protein
MSAPTSARLTPFWNRIPRFFLYPFQPTALVLMVVISLAIPLFAKSLLGVFVAIALLAIFIKYAYSILEHTAQGNLSPPPFSTDFLLGDYSILFKQLAIFLVIGFAFAGIGGVLGPWIAIAFLLLAMLALPASIMVLAVTQSFLRAINPGVIGEVIRAIGWPYLILYAFLFFLNIGSGAASGLFAEAISPEIQVFMLMLISMYFTFIMYNMMGYVIYQYHDELGYPVESEAEFASGQGAAEASPAYEGMDAVERFIEEENFPAAMEEMKSVLRRYPDDISLRLRFHRLVRLTDDVKQLTYHGAGLITRLLDLNRVKDAAEVYLDCAKAHKGFKPENKDEYLPIAQNLRAYGKRAEAVALANGFHRKYPADPVTPELYLLMAEMFIDDMRQEDKARPILDFLAAHYPSHPLAPRIVALRSAIEAAPPAG